MLAALKAQSPGLASQLTAGLVAQRRAKRGSLDPQGAGERPFDSSIGRFVGVGADEQRSY